MFACTSMVKNTDTFWHYTFCNCEKVERSKADTFRGGGGDSLKAVNYLQYGTMYCLVYNPIVMRTIELAQLSQSSPSAAEKPTNFSNPVRKL